MFECECEDEFYYYNDYAYHMDYYGHWPECETCDKTFRTHQACEQHMQVKLHWNPRFKCEECTTVFRYEDDCERHMREKLRWKPQFRCQGCNTVFRYKEDCNDHMDEESHHYCKECDRYFQNSNNLQMHLHSRIHRSASIECPFCKSGYTTASGLSHHLETGSCRNAPQLNRDSILEIIRKRDPKGLITNKQLTWHEGTTGTYTATSAAWNGYGFECYFCQREFNTVRSLDQHLNSPAHRQRVYHCPNHRCEKEFVSLAGLFNHLESETCAFMRFEKVQRQVGHVLNGNRMITF
ncbi:hypothetical protein KC343_g7695 [Hortaea werneckii]|nr:hypothetical protein KC352_g18561 [Hortaea werneckii]KAI7563086.1 hypothetical protein KC317_g7975 [Hortaea werneckii]KAI7612954.1 hypothetical protein KC346_g7564 [Hortaea werneckii]KAI7622287.1 hypothetical protein KC343_g7695 [Hortaea werneckii]KAI7664325.1 hypothetical protein KC319_g7519 [Hortaea werneckii]